MKITGGIFLKKIAFLLIFTLLFSGCSSKNVFKEEIAEEVWQSEEIAVTKELNPNGYGSLSNKLCGWGLKKNLNAPPEVPSSIISLLEKYESYYIGKDTEKVLYLTFDEGYENGYTAKILDVLKEKEVPAAFFITGPYLKKEKELVKRMVEEGHVVGNHTVNHPCLPEVDSVEKISKELSVLDDEFYSEFGKRMRFLRAPRGEFSERTLAITNDLGYTNVFWSFAYKDWEVNNQRGAEYAYNEIMKGVFDGCILLLHAVSKDNAEVLARVIDDLKKDGYVFKSLENLVK